MKTRTTLSATQYMEVPPEARPAMTTVDAVTLLQDMVSRRIDIPEEVRLEANIQVNENLPANWFGYLEEYSGRVRVVVAQKRQGGK